MLKVEDYTIWLTRGDSATIQLALMHKNGQVYEPSEGDEIRFSMKRKMSDNHEPLLTIDIPTDTLILEFAPEDTQAFRYNKSRPYKYDIEIKYSTGNVDTFICDADIYLMPEADVYE